MEIKGRFDHFNINVTNLEKSIQFYEKALGLHESHRKEAADGSFIACAKFPAAVLLSRLARFCICRAVRHQFYHSASSCWHKHLRYSPHSITLRFWIPSRLQILFS